MFLMVLNVLFIYLLIYFLRVHLSKLRQRNKEGLSMEEATGEPGAGAALAQRRLGDRFRGLAWDEVPLPTVPLVASLVGTLRA